ncbi:MAG: hypothetical protein WBC04_17940 [Candidatus Acidiferrales bacterium]
MTRNAKNRYLIALALLVAIAAVSAPQASAQSCAMCYQNAAASGAQGIAALRNGILVLLIPTLTLFIGLFAFLYRRRNAARSDRRFPARYELN